MQSAPRPQGDAWLETPVWVGENDFASRGEVARAPLVGVAKGAYRLQGEYLLVTGKQRFAPGHRPHDPHPTRTYYHDAFTQAELYRDLTRMVETYDRLDLGMRFEALVGAKSGLKRVHAFANDFEETNAYYVPDDETLHFGVALKGGKPVWDLGADSNVSLHELGHFALDHLVPKMSYGGDSGAIHEGYGDAQAAFLTCDPEVGEDFGKVLGRDGEALRSVSNGASIDNTDPEPHDRGRVFAGLLWSLGEHLHEAIVGTYRRSHEPLDARAADAALSLLWTFPLYLGTKTPLRADFLRALHRAVDALAKGGKLPSAVDPALLHARIDREASARGLDRLGLDRGGEAIALGKLAPSEAGITQAFSTLGVDPALYRAEKASEARGPAGEQIVRYTLLRRMDVGRGGAPMDVPLDDDLLTLVRAADGSVTLQVGALREGLRALSRAPVAAPALREVQDVRLPSMTASVRSELATLAASPQSLRPESPHLPSTAHLAERALARLEATPDAAPTLVLRDGRLVARLALGTYAYEAEVGPDGSLEAPRRLLGVIAAA